MKFKDETAEQEWAKFAKVNSSDPYSKACVTYARRWAELMEAEIDLGHELEQIAKPTSHAANDEGITGFMYGAAVSALAKWWVHGEHLRVWHNRDVQLGDEGERANQTGGVLNPAILTVASKE